MSAKCQAWVYEHSEATGNDRLVLLAIADEADDDGANGHPSVDRIAHKARATKRTTLRSIERLEEAGALVVTRPEKRGRGRFNTYAVVMRNGDNLTPFPVENGSPIERTIPEPEMVRNGAQPYLDGSRPIDPSTNNKPLSRRSFPDGFFLTAEMRAWAAKEAPGVDLRFQTQQFADHWRGKGEKRADWVATWRTWIRNARQWSRSTPAAEPVAVVADFVAPPDPNDFDAWMDEHDPGWRERIPQS